MIWIFQPPESAAANTTCVGGWSRRGTFVYHTEAGKAFRNAFCRKFIWRRVRIRSSFNKLGWIRLEGLTLRRTKTQDLVYQVSLGALSDPMPGFSKELMAYMTSIYGKQVLSGQFCPEGQDGIEMQLIRDLTWGKQPAILAMDMMNYSNAAPAGVEPSDVIEQRRPLYWGAGRNSGVVVALVCPGEIPTADRSGGYRCMKVMWIWIWKQFLTEKIRKGYQLLTDDLDHMAEQLKRLRMPVQRCCGDPCMKEQTDGSGGAAAEQNAIKSSGS